MKTVDMYEIGEEVTIKATVTNITVEDGVLKYNLKTEYANNDIGHLFTEDEIIGPLFQEITEEENQTPLS